MTWLVQTLATIRPIAIQWLITDGRCLLHVASQRQIFTTKCGHARQTLTNLIEYLTQHLSTHHAELIDDENPSIAQTLLSSTERWRLLVLRLPTETHRHPKSPVNSRGTILELEGRATSRCCQNTHASLLPHIKLTFDGPHGSRPDSRFDGSRLTGTSSASQDQAKGRRGIIHISSRQEIARELLPRIQRFLLLCLCVCKLLGSRITPQLINVEHILTAPGLPHISQSARLSPRHEILSFPLIPHWVDLAILGIGSALGGRTLALWRGVPWPSGAQSCFSRCLGPITSLDAIVWTIVTERGQTFVDNGTARVFLQELCLVCWASLIRADSLAIRARSTRICLVLGFAVFALLCVRKFDHTGVDRTQKTPIGSKRLPSVPRRTTCTSAPQGFHEVGIPSSILLHDILRHPLEKHWVDEHLHQGEGPPIRRRANIHTLENVIQ